MNKTRPFLKTLSGDKKFKRLLGDSRRLMGLRSGMVVLKAGEAVGEHSTGHKEEVLIILKGRARICCERKRINAGEHSFIYLPSYIRHNVENRGRGLLKYVYITSRQR